MSAASGEPRAAAPCHRGTGAAADAGHRRATCGIRSRKTWRARFVSKVPGDGVEDASNSKMASLAKLPSRTYESYHGDDGPGSLARS